MKVSETIQDFNMYLKFDLQSKEANLKTAKLVMKDFFKTFSTYETWDVTKYHIFHFIEKLRTKNKESTISCKLFRIRQYADFCFYNRIPFLIPKAIPQIELPHPTFVRLSAYEIKKLIEAPFELWKHRLTKFRDSAIIATLASGGMRVSELANIKKDEVDWINGRIHIIGKWEKPRFVYFSPVAVEKINLYFQERVDASPYLFVSTAKKVKDRKMDINSITLMIKTYAEIVLKKKVTAHTLRHFFATMLNKEKVDPFTMRLLMGHKSVETLSIYTHPDDKMFYSAINKVNKQIA